MKKNIFLFLILFVQLCFSQSKLVGISEFTLNNGLKVILNEDHSIPIVVVNTCYHVGSKNEKPQIAGFAHLFEHLMFDGSTNVAKGEFDKYIYSSGGDDNAFTTEDYTNYYDLMPSNQLELALWLESDRMLQFGIKEISLLTQKEVVIEERKQNYENRPYGTVPIKMAELAYKVHPYKWPVIGFAENIQAATLNTVRDFFETFYVPNNAVLVIVGDIDPGNAKKLVEKYFAGIPRGQKTILRPAEIEPEKSVQERAEVKDKVSLPGLFAGFHIPQSGIPDAYALSLLSDILSSGESSRFYQKMVYNDQSAIDASSYADLRENPGLFICSIYSSGKKSIDELEKDLFDELTVIKEKEVSEKELQKVKNSKEAEFIFRLQTPQGRAVLLALYKTFFNDANLINVEINKFLEVTTKDIQKAAQKYLTKENSVVLHYFPEEPKK